MRVLESGELAEALMRSTTADLDALAALPPQRQRDGFLTYALEREQVVDFVYSESATADLIGALDVDEPTRDVVRRAILWLQRDEALHAQYLRGRLLRSRRPRAWAPVFATQAVGLIGGWCSSVSPRHTDDAFGLRRLAARSVLWAGSMLGQLPSELFEALRRPGFEAFCDTNLLLEESAIMAYERLLRIVEGDEHALFTRVLNDEIRHAQVFALFVECFEGNRLRPGTSLADLTAGLRDISPWLVPTSLRTDDNSPERQPQAVAVADDLSLEDAIASVLSETDAASLVADKLVAIRANFMLAYHRDDCSNHVSPELVAELARAFRKAGAIDIELIEAPNVYDQFFDRRSVAEVAAYLGFDSDDYRIVDATDDLVDVHFERGLATTKASRSWIEADVRVVVAKLTGDPSEIVHGILPTVPGLTGRIEDEQFYTHRLVDWRTSALMLLDAAPIDLAVVDAWGKVADGPLGVMGCHRPSAQHRVYAGRNAVAVDATVISDLGVEPSGCEFLRRADQWFGGHGSLHHQPSRLGPLENVRVPQANWWFRLVNAMAVPVYMNLSGNGRLFVPYFDQDAFPSIDSPGWFVRAVRRTSQRAFGLHPQGVRP